MGEAGQRVLELLWFMAPAYAANMAPPFVRFWRGWNRPIHARWLGDHKTVVGYLAGVLAALAAIALQALLHHAFPAGIGPDPLVDYTYWPWLGLAFGAGAMTGDSMKSFFKRRRRVPPGAPWIPFDQLDFAVGALLLVAPFADIGWVDVLVLLAVTFIGDILVNHASWRLGIKRGPW